MVVYAGAWVGARVLAQTTRTGSRTDEMLQG